MYIIFSLSAYIIYKKLFPMNNQFTRLNNYNYVAMNTFKLIEILFRFFVGTT